MDILLNPNIAYVLLVTGVMFALMGLVTPGTGIFELGALFAIALAGYAIYNIGVNPWALIVLALAVAPFFYALRSKPPVRHILMAVTLLMLTAGAVFLFTQADGAMSVHPLVALAVSTLSSGFLWLSVERTLAVMRTHPSHDLASLIGQIGEAKTDIYEAGSVQVAGELWTARSEKSIPVGSSVRVVRREGFTVIVEEAE